MARVKKTIRRDGAPQTLTIGCGGILRQRRQRGGVKRSQFVFIKGIKYMNPGKLRARTQRNKKRPNRKLF